MQQMREPACATGSGVRPTVLNSHIYTFVNCSSGRRTIFWPPRPEGRFAIQSFSTWALASAGAFFAVIELRNMCPEIVIALSREKM